MCVILILVVIALRARTRDALFPLVRTKLILIYSTQLCLGGDTYRMNYNTTAIRGQLAVPPRC